jgi:cyclophilin family peptidyl-prolyl cis-trans isomerase
LEDSASLRRRLLLNPDAPETNRAPERFLVRLETSKGDMLMDVHRDWSPHGVDRFYNLVRAGYYDDARFFRVREGRWAQFGINGDPRISNAWRERTIPDDPRQLANTRGTVAFAFAVPNGRTTQVFINLTNNSATHDAEQFVPFGKIIKGMEVADALNAEYGESAGGGIRGGKQQPLFEQGNSYLLKNFPRLDFIRRATIEASLRSSTFSKATREREEAEFFGIQEIPPPHVGGYQGEVHGEGEGRIHFQIAAGDSPLLANSRLTCGTEPDQSHLIGFTDTFPKSQKTKHERSP